MNDSIVICLCFGLIGTFIAAAVRASFTGLRGRTYSIATVIVGSVVYFAIAAQFHQLNLLGMLIAVAAPVALLLAGDAFYLRMLKDAAQAAPQLEPFFKSRFKQLDADGDGVISEEDLEASRSTVSSDSERELLELFRRDLHLFGHVVSQDATVTPYGVATFNRYGASEAEVNNLGSSVSGRLEQALKY